MSTFDAYNTWLGIPPDEQPPHHYRLLGLKVFESDLRTIEAAVDRRVELLNARTAGEQAAAARELLRQVAAAESCLLNSQRKSVYDSLLYVQLKNRALLRGEPLPPAPVAATESSAAPATARVAAVSPRPVPPPPPTVLRPQRPAAVSTEPTVASATTRPPSGRTRPSRSRANPLVFLAAGLLLLVGIAGSAALMTWLRHQGVSVVELARRYTGGAAGSSSVVSAPLSAAVTVTDTVSDDSTEAAAGTGPAGELPAMPEGKANVGSAPQLAPLADLEVPEEQLVTFVARTAAEDALTAEDSFSLASDAPAGARIDPKTGEFVWTPTEAQGPGEYQITVQLQRPGSEPASRSFHVRVMETNRPPVLASIDDQTVREGQLLELSLPAEDRDLPQASLTFSLGPDSPPGCVIDPLTGKLRWTPAKGLGGQTFIIVATVTDGGDADTGAQTAKSFRISVLKDDSAGVTNAVAAADPRPAGAAAENMPPAQPAESNGPESDSEPVLFACAAEGRDERAYAEQIRNLLTVPGDREQALAAAERAYRAAREICDRDPRADYAYGLILFRHFKYDEAQQRFIAAARSGDYPYFPAWQALIWLQVLRKDQAHAAMEVARYAKTVESSTDVRLTASSRVHAANWIGTMVGYLEGPGTTPKIRETVELLDGQLEKIFTDRRLERYLIAKSDLLDRHSELSEEAVDSDAQRVEANRVKQELIASRKADLADAKGKLAMSAEKWKEWIDQQIAAFDAQLAPLEREYEPLAAEGRYLASQISNCQQEILRLAQQRDRCLLQMESSLAQYYQQLIERENINLAAYQRKYGIADAKARAINSRAANIIAQRDSAIRLYEKETGQIIRSNRAIDAWQKRLSRQSTKLTTDNINRANRAKPVSGNLTALRTYLELDFDSEKLRLLDTFADP